MPPWPALSLGWRADRRPGGQWTLGAGEPGNRPADVLASRPEFQASTEAFNPSVEMVTLQRAALTDAVATGELGPGGPTLNGARVALHPYFQDS